ncbi:hypothetical protein AB0O01_35120 [Streptomyces sp. NPDC093252]|uniref:hypothetical protein n=1 Tax=Streptomyces sp. NPDC093252 TaxID=3154980 RepID=UPI0034253F9E
MTTPHEPPPYPEPEGPDISYDTGPGAPAGPAGTDTLAWPADPGVRVALWAPTNAGKTTFMESVLLGAMRPWQGRAEWTIQTDDPAVQAAINNVIDRLSLGGDLNAPTINPPPLTRWQVRRKATNTARHFPGIPARLRPAPRPDSTAAFELQLQDLPGEVFVKRDHPRRAQVVSLLAEADAFVYLYCPLLEQDDTLQRANAVFREMLDDVARTVRAGNGGLSYLPQHIAVCISKFDDRDVFGPAQRGGFVEREDTPERRPYITEDNARAYFNLLCATYARSHATDFVRTALENRFRPGNIRYYATSALGFHLQDGQTAYGDRVDHPLARSSGGSRYLVQSEVRPVNVLEPVMDLCTAVLSARGRTGGRRP